uniref:Uncharacterized protein n=1 Tax=Parascaris equorum TaxID=6256 RepID=A0A914S9K6_PAREQ
MMPSDRTMQALSGKCMLKQHGIFYDSIINKSKILFELMFKNR